MDALAEYGSERIVERGSTIMDSTSSAERRQRELHEHNDNTRQHEDETVTGVHAGAKTDCSANAQGHNNSIPHKSHSGEKRSPPRGELLSASRKETGKRKTRHEELIEDKDFDELAIGMPKEQYTPRPSRSRSHQMVGDDRSRTSSSQKTPDRKAKRRKTFDSVPREDRTALKDMGFNSSQADKALQEADGNIQRATEWLLDGEKQSTEAPEHDDRKASSLLSQTHKPEAALNKSRGRPRKSQVVPEEEEDDLAGTDRKVESIRVEIKDPQILEQDDEARDKKPRETDKPKKKGRGRPKKQPDKYIEPEPEVQRQSNQDTENAEANTPQEVEEYREVKESANENVTEAETEDVDLMNHSDSLNRPEKIGKEEGARDEKGLSPRTTEKNVIIGSSIKTGKVPYRVGLSRRMRIPSLLSSAKKPPQK